MTVNSGSGLTLSSSTFTFGNANITNSSASPVFVSNATVNFGSLPSTTTTINSEILLNGPGAKLNIGNQQPNLTSSVTINGPSSGSSTPSLTGNTVNCQVYAAGGSTFNIYGSNEVFSPLDNSRLINDFIYVTGPSSVLSFYGNSTSQQTVSTAIRANDQATINFQGGLWYFYDYIAGDINNDSIRIGKSDTANTVTLNINKGNTASTWLEGNGNFEQYWGTTNVNTTAFIEFNQSRFHNGSLTLNPSVEFLTFKNVLFAPIVGDKLTISTWIASKGNGGEILATSVGLFAGSTLNVTQTDAPNPLPPKTTWTLFYWTSGVSGDPQMGDIPAGMTWFNNGKSAGLQTS